MDLEPLRTKAIPFSLLGLSDVSALCGCAVLDMKKAVGFVGVDVLRRQKHIIIDGKTGFLHAQAWQGFRMING